MDNDAHGNDAHGVVKSVKKHLATAFAFLTHKKVVVPPYGTHYYVDKKAEMVHITAGDKEAVFKQLAASVRHAGLVGTAYITHSDPAAKLHPCFAASVNLPDRGLTLVLKYRNTPAGPVADEKGIEVLEDLPLPGNLMALEPN